LVRTFPSYRFSGTHRDIGRQYGESCTALIKKNFEFSFQRLNANVAVTRQEVREKALDYRPYVLKYAPFLDEEIIGLSEACGLPLADMYFLQLRAELEEFFTNKQNSSIRSECTTFISRSGATLNQMPIGGQNADLPGFYGEVSIVMEITSPDFPSILMVSPAGQISYIGINDYGLCVFANYLSCGGWRVGFPRYLLSRLALTQKNVRDAENLLNPIERASSRNLLLLDAAGQAVDLELSVNQSGRIDIQDDIFVHSNHFLAPGLLGEEKSNEQDLHNSKVRLERLETLLRNNHGHLDAVKMKNLLCDRETFPDTLSIEPGDYPDSDYITFASIIAEPAIGQLWVAAGPPSRSTYQPFTFSANSQLKTV